MPMYLIQEEYKEYVVGTRVVSVIADNVPPLATTLKVTPGFNEY